MATCKICNKEFHTCGSCGLVGWEWEYCSIPCRKAGDAKLTGYVTEAFTTPQLQLLRKLLDEETYEGQLYDAICGLLED